ncbi:ATP-binding protein [Chloroflexota bacterium]
MVAYFKQFIASPVFEQDEDKTNQARVLNSLLVNIAIVLILHMAITPLFVVNKLESSILVTLFLGLVLFIRFLIRRGRVRLASLFFVAGAWVVAAMFIFFSGGITNVSPTLFLLLIVFAGLLLGQTAAISVAVISGITALAMVVMATNDYPPPRLFPLPPTSSWMTLILSFVIAIFPLNLMLRTRAEALALARQELAERRQTEAALRQSEERLQLALSAAQMGTWDWDIFTGKVTWSEHVEPIFGLQPGRFAGTYEAYLDLVWPQDLEIVQQVISAVLAGDTEDFQVEHRTTWPDGSIHWIEGKGQVYRDKADQPIRMAGMVTDITTRKQAEAERERLIADLEAKNTELDRFAHTVSHDLKSPLITIRGFLGFLEEDAASGNMAQLHSDLGRISRAADKMQQLLNNLLELSRIGRLINPPEEVSLETIAREAIELAHGRIEARGVQVEIAPNLPVIYGDRLRLVEVMQNLLDNACKFMGDQPQPRIEIGMHEAESQPVFFVRDNGLGIDPPYHERIFDLFDKLDSQSEGTGVGLTLVKRIIEAHRGRIWVESDGTGQGVTFYFTLPVKQANQISDIKDATRQA